MSLCIYLAVNIYVSYITYRRTNGCMLSSQAVLAGCWTTLSKLCHGFEKSWPSLNVRTWIYYLSVSGRTLAHPLIPMHVCPKYTVALLLRGKASFTSFASNVWLGMSLPIFLCRRSMAYRRAITKCKCCFMHNYPTRELEFRGKFRLGVLILEAIQSAILRAPPAIDAKKSSPAPHIAQGPSSVSPVFFEQAGNREQFLQPLTWRRGMRP